MSRLPLEQMMASFRPVGALSPKSGTIVGPLCGVVVVMAIPSLSHALSHAAVWLGQPGDVGHLLGRLSGEQREQFLDGNPGEGGHPAQRGGLALDRIVLAQEPDRPPVRVGELDTDLRGELPGELLVPFVVVGEEGFGVDVDLRHTDGGDGHGCFSSAGWCLPAIDMCAGSGIGRPGSSRCQYSHRKASLPQWLRTFSVSSENGPTIGSG